MDKIRVALIDDDGAVLDALATFLRRRQLGVTTYVAAQPFLEAMDAGTEFDCVVTDVRMPDISGLELQSLLKERVASLPLIIITGHGDIEMAVAAVKAGAADFIEKPTDDNRLAAAIISAVAVSREARQDEAELAELSTRYEQAPRRLKWNLAEGHGVIG